MRAGNIAFLTPPAPRGRSWRSLRALTPRTPARCLQKSFRCECSDLQALQNGTIGWLESSLELEALTPGRVANKLYDLMIHSADLVSFALPGRARSAVWKEFGNKLEAFRLFANVPTALKLPAGVEFCVTDVIERARDAGAYRGLWITEGLGYYYTTRALELGERPLDFAGIARVDPSFNTSLTPLHTGMGLALASRVLKDLPRRTHEADLRDAVRMFIDLCVEYSLEGFSRAPFEALGLVARNLYPRSVPLIDRALLDLDDEFVAGFWHGVGRGLYFSPTNFVPCASLAWRNLKKALRLPPHELGRENALAGLIWALTLVNIRDPEVLEIFLRRHARRIFSKGAFENGVRGALVIWTRWARDPRALERLLDHRVHPSDAAMAGFWAHHVREPAESAGRVAAESPGARDGVDELFRYQPRPKGEKDR